jgi:hypothetical protein
MILRVGYQSLEFKQKVELPKPLTFASVEDALGWLKQVWLENPDVIRRFRDYLSRNSGDQGVFRISDHQVLERLAVSLHSSRVVVLAREVPTQGGTLEPEVDKVDPPFPLSERKRRSAPVAPRAQTILASLCVRLDLTQKQAAKERGKLRLQGTSGGYDKTVAIATNFVANPAPHNTVDVHFEDVPTNSNYSLAYTGGDGTQTTVVQSTPFNNLMQQHRHE